MASTIVTPGQFIPSEHLLYTKPKVNQSGGKSVGIINSTTRRSLMISTPLMLNWGVNAYEKDGAFSYSFSLQFPRDEFSNEQTRQFFKVLQDMENQIKADALKHCRDWFGKNMTKEGIDLIWNPILKYPKDKDSGEPDLSREPTLKVKLPVWEGEYKFELFDVNNELLIPNSDNIGPDAFITKGSNIACVLQCGGLWFANNNFGVSWKLFEGVVKPTEQLKRGVCHIQLSDDDKAQIQSQPAGSDEGSPSAAMKPIQDVTVESDDEGEEQDQEQSEQDETEAEAEQEPEPEPEPEEKKPKKRVVKKKA